MVKTLRRAIKYRLYPTKEQEEIIILNINLARHIWNLMLADATEFYAATDIPFVPTPAKYKKERPYLREADSLALANVQMNLEKAFTKHFKEHAGFPRFKSKKNIKKRSYTTNNQNDTIVVGDNYISLPKFKKSPEIKAVIHRKPQSNWKLKSATISVTPTGKYYCSVLYEFEKDIVPIDVNPQNTIGLDYSSPYLYVDSNNHKPNIKHYYRKLEKRLAIAQQKLSRKEYGSKNYNKQKLAVAKIHEKISNKRLDFLHKESLAIAKLYDAVCVEDLDLTKIAAASKIDGKPVHLGKATLDNGFGLFRYMLDYKLHERGKPLIYTEKHFPSTKTCYCCGFYNPDITLDVREWDCPVCNTHLLRDYNAAINIRDEGLKTFFS